MIEIFRGNKNRKPNYGERLFIGIGFLIAVTIALIKIEKLELIALFRREMERDPSSIGHEIIIYIGLITTFLIGLIMVLQGTVYLIKKSNHKKK